MGTGRGQIWFLAAHPPSSGSFCISERLPAQNDSILNGITGLTEADGRPDKTGKRLTQLEEEQQLLKRLLTLYTE